MENLKNVAPIEDFNWDAYENGESVASASHEELEKAYDNTLNKVNDREVVDGTVIAMNKRRGQVEGMESSRSGARIVKAMVPLAEMFGYVTALRTITSGRATSSMVYSHHAQVSNSIAKAVLEEVKGRADLI